MLIISGEEVKQTLSMQASLEAVEKAYLDLGRDRAVNRQRTDSWVPADNGRDYYLLKSMDGVAPGLKIGAVRVNSNLVTWRSYAGGLVKAGSGKRYVGLVMLFDMTDGEPLALFPDEHIQAVRVGATTGLAIKYLAGGEIGRAAVIGSGRQANTAIEALCCLRKPREIAIYSPNEGRRAALAAKFTGLGQNAVTAPSMEAAVEGADMILFCTSSITPVCRPEWVVPGRFISCVKYAEVGDQVLSKSGFVVVNAHVGSPVNYLPGRSAFASHDPLEELGVARGQAGPGQEEADWTVYPELARVVAGAAGKPDRGQSSLFINTIGLGIQFAAVGAVVYAGARKLGLGIEVPL